MPNQKLTYFSMFSGIGGFELGIQQAMPEAKCVGYSEIDKYAESIYRYNFPYHEGFGDATRIIPSELPDFNFLVGGFPCQAFSIAGKRGGFQDARGTLFFEIARILKDKRPRYILLENVQGLLSHQRGETFQTILGILTDIGYLLQWEVLNSENYGVPQYRPRIYFVGHLGKTCGTEVFPVGADDAVYKPSVRSRLKYIGAVVGPKSSKRIVGDGHKSRQFREGQRIYSSDGVACAITKNKGYHGRSTGLYAISRQWRIYSQSGSAVSLAGNAGGVGAKTGLYETVHGIRRLTPLESEREQGFPDGWTLRGYTDNAVLPISDTQRYKCLGNAVTVNVIRYIVGRMFLAGGGK